MRIRFSGRHRRLLPKPGRDPDLDVSAVIALRLDLDAEFADRTSYERIVDELLAVGLRTEVIDPQSLGDVYDSIHRIAELLGIAARGAKLVAEMRAAMPQSKRTENPPNILVEWRPKLVIAPGRQSWVTDMIELAGGTNPWSSREARERGNQRR